MPSVYSTKLGALTLSLTLLAMLSFSTQSSEPMTKRVIQIHLEMYSSQDKVNEECEADADRNVNGCSWQLGQSRYKIVTLKVRDWCDWGRLRTLGHEVMHAAGFKHSDEYALSARGNLVSWYSFDCEMTR